MLLDIDFSLLFLLLLFVLVDVNSSLNLAPSKGSTFMLFQAVFLLFHVLVCLWTSKQKDWWMVVSSLTLHSGQSYPGTPERPGSRTGTHPK